MSIDVTESVCARTVCVQAPVLASTPRSNSSRAAGRTRVEVEELDVPIVVSGDEQRQRRMSDDRVDLRDRRSLCAKRQLIGVFKE